MKLPNTSMETILNADKLPTGELMSFKIISTRSEQPSDEWIAAGGDPTEFEPSWAFGTTEITGIDNPELDENEWKGRRVDIGLISSRLGPIGLFALVKHKNLYNPDEGWEGGIPRNEDGEQKLENLHGVEFIGKIRSYTSGKGEAKYEVRPLVYK